MIRARRRAAVEAPIPITTPTPIRTQQQCLIPRRSPSISTVIWTTTRLPGLVGAGVATVVVLVVEVAETVGETLPLIGTAGAVGCVAGSVTLGQFAVGIVAILGVGEGGQEEEREKRLKKGLHGWVCLSHCWYAFVGEWKRSRR